MSKNLSYIKDEILAIKDFPKKGIIFRDITPLFKNPSYIKAIIEQMKELVSDLDIDVVIGAESRGFLFGVPLALSLDKPFVLVRKPNKLPRETYSQEFKLEYGASRVEIQIDDLKPKQKVLIVDDLLATGGTVRAIEKLVSKVGAVTIGCLFLIELEKLNGKLNLNSESFSIFKY